MQASDRARLHAALSDANRVALVDALAEADRTPGSLSSELGVSTNLLAHHLRVLEDAGVVTVRRSDGDGRRRYASLRRGALRHLLPHRLRAEGDVLFVCTHNSARSQFAAALWSGNSASAGWAPADAVHPLAIQVAAEHGLDLSAATPQSYDDLEAEPDLVVSVCDRAFEAGTPFGEPDVHWSVPDPRDADTISAFRRAFDDIATRIDYMKGAP